MPLSSRHPDERVGIPEGDPLPPDDHLLPVALVPVDRLYREHRPGLLRFVRTRTSAENAADLVQQAFARFLGLGPGRRATIANPLGYIRRSAANLVLDEAKADRRRSGAHHVPLDDVDLHGPDQIAALEARDMLQRLEQAMQRLKPRTREIFLAHRIDGYSYVEIAALTGLSVKGVEKHMSLAIAFVDRVLAGR